MKTFLMVSLIFISDAWGARLKDISNIRGVRENQLIGYGLVVGLKGTGDGKSEYTSKSLLRMLDKLGVKLDATEVSSKNVAAVIVTANLPSFAKAGNNLDITVSSVGDASSLAGGMLLQTPLKAANEEVFAVAQGALVLGGDPGHPTVARMPNGAIIERDLASDFASRKMFRLTLNNPDFTTAARTALTLNRELGGHYAVAKDGGTVDIVVPFSFEGRGVELLATIEGVEVNPDSKAKIVFNEKTGTVVMGDKVRIGKVAISHGSLTVKIGKTDKADSEKNQNKTSQEGGDRVGIIEGGASVGDLVQSLNRLGVTPKDLITILQAMKAAGALNGDLEVL